MKGLHPILFIIMLLALTGFNGMSQVTADSIEVDTVLVKVKKGSIFSGRPGKSMLLSLILPGTGQIYNKSYLRVPFVYGAVGGMGFLLSETSRYYKCRNAAYIASVDGVPYVAPCAKCESGLQLITDGPRLRLLRDEANANRQLAIIGFSLVWLANGIDAFVDAHLKDFDIDENLTWEVGPRFDNDPHAPMRIGLFVHF